MKLGRERRLSKAAAVGLAVAAIGAPAAGATTIPYLSHGQGISEAQMAQLQNITPSADSRYQVYGGWEEHMVATSDGPAIGVAGRYFNAGDGAVTAQSDAVIAPDDRLIKRPGPGDVSVPSAPSSTGDGFNWGDASIGAGSVLGLVLLAGAAVFTVRRSRESQLAGA